MTFEERLDAWSRLSVIAALVGTALLFLPNPSDAFTLPKATVLVLSALVGVTCRVARWIVVREIRLPVAPVAIAAALFVVGMLISLAASTNRRESLVGHIGQREGAAEYIAGALLFLVTIVSFRPIDVRRLVQAVALCAVVAGGYAILQWQGIEPVNFAHITIMGTMGNPDFLAGWAAVAAPICLVGAANRSLTTGWRAVSALGGVLVVVAGLVSSFQGPVALAAAAAFLIVAAALLNRRALPRRAWVGGAAAVLVAVVLGSVLLGGYARSQVEEGLQGRRQFWSVAVEVVQGRPLTGTGPDTFPDQFLPRRPVSHARTLGANAGSVHDVFLGIAANDGLLSALPFLGFVLATGAALVQGIRRTSGERRLVLVGFGAAWTAYVVQAAVSIDRPHLNTIHWVLAGAIVVLAGPIRTRDVALPGEAVATGNELGAAAAAGIGAIVLVALCAGFVALRPLRADLADVRAGNALGHANAPLALASVESARHLAPWVAKYTYTEVRIRVAMGDRAAAIRAAEEGARLSPGDSSYALVAADTADSAGEHPLATTWYDRAIRVDPHGVDVLLRAADAAARAGEAGRARTMIDRALGVTSVKAEVWRSVQLIRTRLGDTTGAAAAKRKADAEHAKAYQGIGT